MAKIIMGAIVSQIRGKLRGNTFSRNTSGDYIQVQPTRINRRTIAQSNQRNIFSKFSQQWGSLTENERLQWNIAAECHPMDKNCTTPTGASGFNLYVRANLNLFTIKEPEITTPKLLTIVKGFTSLTTIADTTTGTLEVVFSPVIDASSKIIISVTPGMRPGRSSAKTKFKQIIVLDSTDVSPVNIAPAYIIVFGALPVIGTKVFMQSKAVNVLTGRAGSILRALDITA